ncbi:hypothetical protein FN976_24240 [Caenimonas sedimenti]|uniref:Uncharacterized protein n=1 Tax=Caenimonas sedimenti TaxID=2596921 RepID=A0A562ZIN1_9BURK|nr:hypothetical protein [Caenimonas sedimenti]TWO68054.1 hypothetical protein FN976_24240 [Caenimonas sedimenti]
MDFAFPQRLPIVIKPAARCDLMLGVAGHARPRTRLVGLATSAVLAAILAAWLVNSMDWSFGNLRLLIAVCLGSLVAALVLAVGWGLEPHNMDSWILRALAATVTSVLPLIA